uniref:STAS/SEC14 domain-containing protein n=1 Tax=Thermosporothrix sp. COM3 TaxID=2490863 RepID=A0A455SHK8_9CHLR|nr:hypothetical protein KTC_11330 [Thermosporothrix sp. COM3]
MYSFNEEQWPIVSIHNDGETTLADMEKHIAFWERCLARQEPFGVLLTQNGEAQQSSKEVRALSNQWRLANKPRIAQYCAGMAMVTTSSKMLALYKPIAAMIARKSMGCPGQIFTSKEQARSWLMQHIEQLTFLYTTRD